jgi:ketosteroid isomerase-like protein
MDSRSLIASFFACWRVQDLEMALVHVHPDIVYVIHNGPDASPLAGVYCGIDRVRELGYRVLAEFDYIRYEPTILGADDDIVRAQVVFGLRHRGSGHIIEGSQRSVFVVRDGVITSIDVYEDALKVAAFMRLARGSAQLDNGFDLSDLPITGRQTSGAGA